MPTQRLSLVAGGCEKLEKKIAIIDLGGQYCHLIGRRLGDLGIHSCIYGPATRPRVLAGHAGIILSGGPRGVYEKGAPKINPGVLRLGLPILGICYGHQLLAQMMGAQVEKGRGEYGSTKLTVVANDAIFVETPKEQAVWMSHGDTVVQLPSGLVTLASTEQCRIAAFADPARRFYGVQFHPEVVHTEYGTHILRCFLSSICGLQIRADVKDRVKQLVANARESLGEKSVFFLVSGGVDSTVAFVLCSKALPKERVLGLYVDTGLMRKGETEELRANLGALGLLDRLRVSDSASLFLDALRDVIDPEKKRRVIGRLFVEVQSKAMKQYGINQWHWLLGQGTIYPDTIESGGAKGRAAVIKTHHNRCPEIRALLRKGRVIEPLAEFYKDEVRQVGRLLGLNPKLTNRWPFPGPGLAIRCLCTRRRERVKPVGLAIDLNYEAELIPVKSVGVQGDIRTYRQVVALRDRRGRLDYGALQSVSTKLCNVHTKTNRVIAFISGNVDSLKEASVIPATLTSERLELLREADFIVRSMMDEAGLTESVWQFPVVLVPISFHDGETVILRPVNSEDGMTANFARLPTDLVYRIAEKITRLGKVDAVFLDVTSKPPATIEWE
ncbi:MAG: glutamine-hydrolyzing GMP synthase [Candidatus Binatia bacterium]